MCIFAIKGKERRFERALRATRVRDGARASTTNTQKRATFENPLPAVATVASFALDLPFASSSPSDFRSLPSLSLPKNLSRLTSDSIIIFADRPVYSRRLRLDVGVAPIFAYEHSSTYLPAYPTTSTNTCFARCSKKTVRSRGCRERRNEMERGGKGKERGGVR